MRIHALRRPALAAVAIAAALTGCGSTTSSHPASHGPASGSFPVTVQAANGAVHLTHRPHSIMSLSPTTTEMLYAIGAGSQVREVDNDSNFPSQAPHTKLSGFTPNVEAIVGYKPDLVVISNNIGNIAKRLAAFSIPVLELPAPGSLSADYAEYTQLGRATGHLAAAEREVATLRGQISKIVAAAPRHTHPVTYYWELDQTYYSVTSSTFIGQLLAPLGLKSIADAAKGAAAAGGYPQLSAEYILRANPSYIILADTVCCGQDAAKVAKRPGWASLAAVKRGRIVALNDDIASRWGPRIVILLQDVLAALGSHGSQ